MKEQRGQCENPPMANFFWGACAAASPTAHRGAIHCTQDGAAALPADNPMAHRGLPTAHWAVSASKARGVLYVFRGVSHSLC